MRHEVEVPSAMGEKSVSQIETDPKAASLPLLEIIDKPPTLAMPP